MGNKFESFIHRSQNIGLSVASNSFFDSIRENMNSHFSRIIEDLGAVKDLTDSFRDMKVEKTDKMLPFEMKEREGPRIPKASSAALKRRKSMLDDNVVINEKTSPLVGVLSKKKTTHPTVTKPEMLLKRTESNIPPINAPPPPSIKTDSLVTKQVTTPREQPLYV